MTTLKTPFLTILVILFLTFKLYSQSSMENTEVIRTIYDAIENNNSPSIVATLSKDMNWYSTNKSGDQESNTQENKLTPDIISQLQNEWYHFSFNNLNFEEIEKNVVLVTGEISGRQFGECVIVNSEFHHLWWLNDGKVIKFLE